jgi:hypothetical protein
MIHRLNQREISDLNTSVGLLADRCRDIATVQDHIADTDAALGQARANAVSNRGVAEELERLKAKLARATRVEIHVPD